MVDIVRNASFLCGNGQSSEATRYLLGENEREIARETVAGEENVEKKEEEEKEEEEDDGEETGEKGISCV